jgi:DNA-binding MarR family transcriptional regulator
MSLTATSTLSTLDRTGPRRITDLAAVEGVAQPSMTVLVGGLERSGLVERRADPTDGRVALVAVTEAGSNYIRARRRAGAEAFVQLLEKLPADEVATLVAAIPALEHLRELDDEEREPPTRSSGWRAEVPQ